MKKHDRMIVEEVFVEEHSSVASKIGQSLVYFFFLAVGLFLVEAGNLRTSVTPVGDQALHYSRVGTLYLQIGYPVVVIMIIALLWIWIKN